MPSLVYGSAKLAHGPLSIATSTGGKVTIDATDVKTMGDLRQRVEDGLGLKGGVLITAGKMRKDDQPFDISGSDSMSTYIVKEMKEVELPVTDTVHGDKVVQVKYLYGQRLSYGTYQLNPDKGAKGLIYTYEHHPDGKVTQGPPEVVTITPEIVELVKSGQLILRYAIPKK